MNGFRVMAPDGRIVDARWAEDMIAEAQRKIAYHRYELGELEQKLDLLRELSRILTQ